MPSRRAGSFMTKLGVILWGVCLPAAVLFQLVVHAPAVGVPLFLVVAGAVAVHLVRKARRAEQQRVRSAHEAHMHEVQSREIARYHTMGPTEFEQAIAYLCQRDGCTNVQVVGGAGDLGADVKADAPDGRRIVIQCKRYGPKHKVDSPDMQRFGGTCYSQHLAHVPVMVTTSEVTRQAAAYAASQGIRVYNGQALAGWASRTGPATWH